MEWWGWLLVLLGIAWGATGVLSVFWLWALLLMVSRKGKRREPQPWWLWAAAVFVGPLMITLFLIEHLAYRRARDQKGN